MSGVTLGPLELTGRSRSHLVDCKELSCALHPDVVEPLLDMRRAAARDGIELGIASSFRDFATQLRIWNEKWTGQRILNDRRGRRLDVQALTPVERVEAILIWSAPPGGSRHHWGTEVDVYDRAALQSGERLQLVSEEYGPRGPFAHLTTWLDQNMGRWGFYRPYATDRGGVAPEPWHLSHAPTAREASRRLRLATIRRALLSSEIAGGPALIQALPEIYARYIRSVDSPPRGLVRSAGNSLRSRR
jgi:LAS superfamily LD-carboxypeptidase LdcB